MLFESRIEEPFRGEPKSISVWRSDYNLHSASRGRYLQETIKFLPHKKPSERIVYHADETVYFRVLYRYSPAGWLSEVISLQPSGALSQLQKVQALPDGSDVTETLDKNGTAIQRTITQYDGSGRIEWVRTEDLDPTSDNETVEIKVTYGESGDLVEQNVRFKRRNGEILFVDERYLSDERVITLSQAESASAPVVKISPPSGFKGLQHEVLKRDQRGNWIKKEIYTSGAGDEHKGSAIEVSRKITYY